MSRFSRFVEIFEICWNFSRFIKIYQDFSTLLWLFEVLLDQKSWQIEKSQSRNIIKLTNSRLRLRQTVKICQKCHVSTDFLILIETFETGRWCRDKIEISPSQLRLLNHQDKLFEIVKIFSTVKIKSLNRDTIKTNWDPQAYLFHSIKSFCVPFFSR